MSIQKYFCLLFIIISCAVAIYSFAQPLQGNMLIDSLQKDLSKPKDDTSKIKTLYKLAVVFASNDSAVAFNYANQCMNISRKANWKKGIGLSYLSYARVYYEISNFNASLQNSRMAYKIFVTTGNKKDMADALKITGINYAGLGNYVKCIETDLAALKLYEAIDNKSGIEAMYNNIGSTYSDMSDFTKALSYYNKSLIMSKELHNQTGIASALNGLANIYDNEGKYESANNYSLQAIEIFTQTDDKPGLAMQYCNHGDILLELHNAKSAYEYYNRAIVINKKLGITRELATDYGSIGELYFTLANETTANYILSPQLKSDKKTLLKKAQYYFNEAIVLGKDIGDLQFSMHFAQLASETEEQLGNYRTALAFHKDYTLYKDSIYNDENKKKIAAMETQRLTEVKDKEIQLLNQQKALESLEVKRQTLIKNIIIGSVIIAAALAFVFIRVYTRRKKAAFDKQVMDVEMKALRAQMNPHFIFNSLQSINRYIVENDKESASAYLSKFANLMRLILENSREQEVSLEKDLNALELYMQLEALRFKNKFSYSIETDAEINKENTLIPPMLLQPFVENIIVHGFNQTEKGMIKVIVNKENDMVKCVVEDNGSGRQITSVINGDENKKRKSLGLKIISERLSIINQLKKVKAAINIFDLKDAEDKPIGLRVELLLPFEPVF